MKVKNFLSNIFKAKNATRFILNMYILIIIIGAFILMLPISSNSGNFTSLMDALFTTVSAICVTGLTTVTTATHWSVIGKFVIIILIQLGGLGIMTAASIISLIFNKKMSISDRLHLSEEKNTVSIQGIIRLIKFIIYSTFIIEAVGAIFFMFTFIPEYGLIKGVAYSFFHSISAFCNAGFDIIGSESLTKYALNVNVSLVISVLIIVGGIGYKVITELLEKKLNFKKYTLHTKLVIIMTISLLIFPTIFFMIVEWNNPETLGQYGFFGKLLVSFFESTTLRTAGFFTTNQKMYSNASSLIMILMMFIGGSPAGTAGGFKTTSFASMFLITKSNVKQEKNIVVFKRTISSQITKKIITLFTISIAWIFTITILMSITDSSKDFIDVLYEILSAYGTVGLTRGITPDLSALGKIFIMATMIFGKIGPISMIYAFIGKSKPKTFKEQEENILIG
ncbi:MULTISPECIES: TrkH family potassium uptake protein [Helcococcus]|uniref:Potassium transporter TrkG n=1 Tax=Helcococcus bovis TaxID=3153252 RepID=A0ABW9F4K2_9FIRM